MELPPLVQLMQLGAALGLGALLGLLYDLLRAVRRSLARRAWGFDLLYCLCCLAALFLLGMGCGEGQLRIFMAAAAALGVGLYLAIISPLLLPVLLRAANIILLPAVKAKKMLKYFSVFWQALRLVCRHRKVPAS